MRIKVNSVPIPNPRYADDTVSEEFELNININKTKLMIISHNKHL